MKSFEIVMAAMALIAPAQDLQNLVSLDHLQAKAKDTVEVNLDGNLLNIAKKFLSASEPKEAEAKKLLENVRGIYVRVFEFNKEGEYSPADVEKIRTNVKGPGWERPINVRSKQASGDNVSVFVKTDGDAIQGLLILAAEPRQLAVVNIVGSLRPEDIRKLGALGLPGLPGMAKESKSGGKKDEE